MGRPDSYRSIYADLRQRILRGDLRAGERLPSTREAALGLGVARMTVVRAYRQLLGEGYLVSRDRSATMVAPVAPDKLLSVDRALPAAGLSRPARAAPVAKPLVFAPQTPDLDVFPYPAWARAAGRAARALHGDVLGYGDPAGVHALRHAIAEHWRSTRGARMEADRMIVTGGAQNAFHLVGRALARPGDLAVVEAPGYPYVRAAWRRAGLDVKGVAVDAEGLIVAALEQLARPARLIYVTPTHQQPTGVAMSLPRRLALLDYARRHGSYVIEDDYDSEFRYEGKPFPVLQSLDSHGRVILVSSFSKTMFPALRLGFACLPSRLEQDLLVRAQDDVVRSVSLLDQLTLAAFIGEGSYARHLRRMRRHYSRRRDELRALIDGPAGRKLRERAFIEWPHTGFAAVAWLLGPRRDLGALGRRLSDHGLGAVVFETRRQARQALLLGFGHSSSERMLEAIRVLPRFL
jgi:GntR family transcriptional regulator/MocR family aminotransferase